MAHARKAKEEIEQKENQKAGSGALWQNKLTVPKPPKLATKEKKENPQFRKSQERI